MRDFRFSRRCVLVFVLAAVSSMLRVFAQPTDKPVTFVLPLGLPSPGPSNLDAATVKLGQNLFQARNLSRDGSTACISCHDPALGFTDSRRFSIGVQGAQSTRRALPIFNLYIYKNYMADGRAPSLSSQHLIPLQSKEMQVDWSAACRLIDAEPVSRQLMTAARFQRCSKAIILTSLASYVSSLVSGGSRFDRFYYGNDNSALNAQEQRGLRIFVRKARCSSCHLLDGGAAPFTDGGFHSVGVGFLGDVYSDHGRMDATHSVADDGLFKTPTLRNVAIRSFFMHDGSMHSLKDVIDYYDRGATVHARNLDQRVLPLMLSAAEKSDLIAFLGSLNAPVISLGTEER